MGYSGVKKGDERGRLLLLLLLERSDGRTARYADESVASANSFSLNTPMRTLGFSLRS